MCFANGYPYTQKKGYPANFNGLNKNDECGSVMGTDIPTKKMNKYSCKFYIYVLTATGWFTSAFFVCTKLLVHKGFSKQVYIPSLRAKGSVKERNCLAEFIMNLYTQKVHITLNFEDDPLCIFVSINIVILSFNSDNKLYFFLSWVFSYFLSEFHRAACCNYANQNTQSSQPEPTAF
jgi:hypothetical protein